jgi:hypothetical protein
MHLRLVSSAPAQHDDPVMYLTRGLRAWHAYQCLPRTPRGNLPDVRALEREAKRKHPKLYHQAIQKFMYDEIKSPGYEVLEGIAFALNTTPAWLLREDGDPPTTTNQISPRPPKNSLKQAAARKKASIIGRRRVNSA